MKQNKKWNYDNISELCVNQNRTHNTKRKVQAMREFLIWL